MQKADSVFRLDGKVALVVGGGSGIGHAAAVALGDSGAAIACADVNEDNAQKTAAETRGKAFTLDIRSKSSVETVVSAVLTQFGRIDILVVTPAVNVRKRLLSYTDEELDKVVDLNLKGNFRITRAVAEVMSKNPAGGSIILTSSIRSVTVEPGQGVYPRPRPRWCS